ncbi:MAG: D-glycero-beta-D-manno-heptose 1-phosphate adenylyltransferase [Pseudomonadota bacterium]
MPPGYLKKIMAWPPAGDLARDARARGGLAVFTNGCFDLLHAGHVRYLAEARTRGDILIVGLNSDRSVREIKGPGRPVTPQDQRAEVLAALECVDAVVVFDQADPLALIESIEPDVLIKGGDWSLDRVVGRKEVEARGGRVLTIPLTPGVSTSAIIERILEREKNSRGPRE